MAELLSFSLSFPCVIYTVLLGAAVVYWLFVIVGAASVDLLGDGVADGVGHGDAVGDLAHAALGHGADGDGHEVGHHHAPGEHASEGIFSGILAALKLRRAPVTVVLSVFVLFAWLASMTAMQLAHAFLSPAFVGFVRLGVFLVAPLLALPVTSLVVRPLAKIFVPHAAPPRRDLVGKVCTIRTGTVTPKFGEATLEDGGAGLLLRVRVEAGETLQRGDRAIVVSYDEESHEFTVTKADEMLDEPKGRLAP